jgi:hypothetical protein
MRLPSAFPHTRHEQYLAALPDHLLEQAELEDKIRLLDRLGTHEHGREAWLEELIREFRRRAQQETS